VMDLREVILAPEAPVTHAMATPSSRASTPRVTKSSSPR
jgi:hypothetical protein